jgi:hypothetical protein
MQLAASWRMPITDRTGFTIAGGPAGEPALGPVAFMHRPSASENSFAPLSHHVFDSTHVSFGVVTAAVDHGPWFVEGSVFNGREPDENRWDLDFGALDSVSGRVWLRPTDRWEFQVSSGRLNDPEASEPGDLQRTTASAAWFKREGDDFTAVTAAYGVNAGDHGRRHAALGEITRRGGPNSFFARMELVQVETAKLRLCCTILPLDPELRDTVGAFTLGAVRNLPQWRGFESGVGLMATFHATPNRLRSSYGDHPISFQVSFRLRPPAAAGMGRMWNMRMSQPMAGHMPH